MYQPMTPKTIEYAQTKYGTLRGFRQKDIYHFLDVRYGHCKRWQTATMVQPWKGVQNALQFGNRAFPASDFTPWDSCGLAHEAYPLSEDCLNLNIWSPSLDPAAKKPVMVWIHGGGYSSGFAVEMQAYDGEALSRWGDVVVVSVNHRLNIFGFLDVSPYGPQYENSGNCGISDLVLALQWVRGNIANFGGDADNVTIFGQSGGGGKVRTLLQTPAADGLFHKAIVMSGAGASPMPGTKVDEGSELSQRMLTGLFEKVGDNRIEALEALTPEELLDAAKEVSKEIGISPISGTVHWHPVANDWYPGDATVVGIREHARNIPVMVGCTISEMPLMRIFNKHSYSKEEQIAIVQEAFPNQDVERLLDLFRAAWPNKCLTDVIEIQGALGGRENTVGYADLRASCCAAPTYNYLFAHDFPQDGGRGAWHCADLPAVFHNSALYPAAYSDGMLDGLEDAMCASWVSFARNGDPNNEYLGLHWPAYQTGECAVMIFDNEREVKYDFDRELTICRSNMELKVLAKYSKFTQLVN